MEGAIPSVANDIIIMTISLTVLPKVTGYTLFEGASQLDGNPIVVIMTLDSHNQKTGNVLQTWIIRSDMNPLDASASNADASVCGNCVHRGVNGKARTCYVNLAQAPLNIYRTYRAGKYPYLDKSKYEQVFKNKSIRLGSFGDPASLEIKFWTEILSHVGGWLGYTHQWKNVDPKWSQIVMASVDSRKEYQQAKKLGYRTFRVKSETDLMYKREFVCPASKEGGNRLQCNECFACSGTRFGKLSRKAGDVVINVHGFKGILNTFKRRKSRKSRSATI